MNAYIYMISFIIIFITVSIVSAITTFKFAKKGMNEKIKLDISIEDMRKSEKRISAFLIANQLGDDKSIYDIAEILNVEQGGTEQGLQDQAYLKDCDDHKKIVVFKPDLSERQQHFVFAHEIAHLINGDEIPVTRPNARNKSKIEQLADYTAAALLMPLDAVYTYLENNLYQNISVKERAKIVKELCEKYNVTEVIVLRRIKEVYVLKQDKKQIKENVC